MTEKKSRKGIGGRPRKFSSPEELEAKIEQYFREKCKDEIIKSDDGEPVYNKFGGLQVKENPPTTTGLALFLGFVDRQSLYDYIKRGDEFSCIMKKAASTIEEYVEKRLLSNGGAPHIFWLKNYGWRDKQEVEHSGKVEQVQIIDNIRGKSKA